MLSTYCISNNMYNIIENTKYIIRLTSEIILYIGKKHCLLTCIFSKILSNSASLMTILANRLICMQLYSNFTTFSKF